jgi:hypothetical protein
MKVRRAAATKGMNDINGCRASAGVASAAVHEPMLAARSDVVTHIPPNTDEQEQQAVT